MYLFIMTTKLTKAKAITAAVIIGLLLCGLIFCANHANKSEPPSPIAVSDNEGRVAYLKAWGWEVDPSAIETLDLVLPKEFDDAYASYNTVQTEIGFDLAPYCGKHVKRYTYTVLNYPGITENIQANLYLSGDTVIAGDIISSGIDGFIASLLYPH